VRPALAQHLYPAIIDPTHYVKLIRHGVVIALILAAESVVGHDCGEIVLALTSLPQSTLRTNTVIAVVR
jgi:hypothetical protein